MVKLVNEYLQRFTAQCRPHIWCQTVHCLCTELQENAMLTLSVPKPNRSISLITNHLWITGRSSEILITEHRSIQSFQTTITFIWHNQMRTPYLVAYDPPLDIELTMKCRESSQPYSEYAKESQWALRISKQGSFNRWKLTNKTD